MKMILLLSILTTLLMANNPYAYSVIGDRVYENMENILKLRKIVQYKQDKAKINSYYFDVHELKLMGYKLDSNDKSIDKIISINKGDGFWIYNDGMEQVSFSGNSYNILVDSKILNSADTSFCKIPKFSEPSVYSKSAKGLTPVKAKRVFVTFAYLLEEFLKLKESNRLGSEAVKKLTSNNFVRS